jgi:DNA topoisomerase VI subunit A
MEDAEALEAVGIIKTMEELLFYGPLKVKLFDQQIDFGLFRYGASMNTGMIRDFEVTGLDAAKVITIENKANFIEYIKREDIKDTLVVYLGGFYSPVKRVFLKKIYDYIESRGIDVSFQHWGDIDLGGFNIFIQLKSKLLDSLSPLYMDAETLRKYRSSAGKFESSYGKKLERLLHDERYAAFHEVINEMLKSSIKLEQEALL